MKLINKFEDCDKRMKSFENAIGEILTFTKKAYKDIQDIQMNLSQNNMINKNKPKQVNLFDVQADSDSLSYSSDLKPSMTNDHRHMLCGGEENIDLSKSTNKIDDTVNYNSLQYQSMQGSMPNKSIKIDRNFRSFGSSYIANNPNNDSKFINNSFHPNFYLI